MDALTSARVALPAAALAVVLLTFVVPAARLRMRHGTWGVVFHRRADPFQSIVGTAMGLCVAALVAGVALFSVLGPAALALWPAPAWVSVVGWAVIGAGLITTAIAQAQMGRAWRIGIDDRPTPLVTHGLYACVRNPIFTAMLAMMAGGLLVVPCAASAGLLAATAIVVVFQSRLEEQHLASLHGDAYRSWAARVGRFWPGIGRLR